MKYILLVILVLSSFLSKAENFTKNISRSFETVPNMPVSLENIYGNIRVEKSADANVRFDVSIRVDCNTKFEAEAIFKRIEIKFRSEESGLYVETVIDEDTKNCFTVDYLIRIPIEKTLNITNSFGNVFVNNRSGKTNVDIQYGNFLAQRLDFGSTKPVGIINVKFGDIIIDECDWLKICCDYGKVKVNRAEALMLKTKYSVLNIGTANSIVADSKFDTLFTIKNIENLVFTGLCSTVVTEHFYKLMNFEGKYCKLYVKNAHAEFSSIKLNITLGVAEINLAANAGCRIKALCTYGNISVPKDSRVKRSIDRIDTSLEGYIKLQNSGSQLTINGKYTNFNIKTY